MPSHTNQMPSKDAAQKMARLKERIFERHMLIAEFLIWCFVPFCGHISEDKQLVGTNEFVFGGVELPGHLNEVGGAKMPDVALRGDKNGRGAVKVFGGFGNVLHHLADGGRVSGREADGAQAVVDAGVFAALVREAEEVGAIF